MFFFFSLIDTSFCRKVKNFIHFFFWKNYQLRYVGRYECCSNLKVLIFHILDVWKSCNFSLQNKELRLDHDHKQHNSLSSEFFALNHEVVRVRHDFEFILGMRGMAKFEVWKFDNWHFFHKAVNNVEKLDLAFEVCYFMDISKLI